MAKKKTSTKPKTQAKKADTEKTAIEFPNVQPPSRMTRNQPKPPTTLRVCGNVIPVRNGRAGEARPEVLKQRRIDQKRKLSEKTGKKFDIDETRI